MYLALTKGKRPPQAGRRLEVGSFVSGVKTNRRVLGQEARKPTENRVRRTPLAQDLVGLRHLSTQVRIPSYLHTCVNSGYEIGDASRNRIEHFSSLNLFLI